MEGRGIDVRLLMLGGSFNPIHIGHLILAEEACAVLGYTHVALVPAAMRPQKNLESDPGPEARLEMTRAAAAGDPNLIVWDGEIRRGGLSYSIDTVRELVKYFNLEERPGFIVGDDLLAGFPQWRSPDLLEKETRLICAHRESAERREFPYEHTYLNNLLIPISSHLVRERIAKGLPCRRLVPEGVWSIIEGKGYYRHG
jgi:nicotinate-nucleotide adenylyltransferase